MEATSLRLVNLGKAGMGFWMGMVTSMKTVWLIAWGLAQYPTRALLAVTQLQHHYQLLHLFQEEISALSRHQVSHVVHMITGSCGPDLTATLFASHSRLTMFEGIAFATEL